MQPGNSKTNSFQTNKNKMKNILSVISIILFACTVRGYCQATSEISEDYKKYAVPFFDNEKRELDWDKVEVKPILLYRPQQQKNSGNGNSAMSVTDNTDVQVFPSATAQSEQHMTVSKVRPGNIILTSNTTNQGHYISQNGGTTWLSTISSNFLPDGAPCSGDPTDAMNVEGDIFMETMTTGTTGYRVYTSTNQGNTWGTAVQYTYSTMNFDKEMMAIDNIPFSPFSNNIYTAWTDFGASTTVRFNRSTDGGATYQADIILHSGYGQGTNVQTGENGQVYICWANYGSGSLPADGIGFSRSLNGGSSFTDLTPVFSYAGIRISNSGNPLFNSTRVNDFPSMAVDKSCIATGHRGRIYIAYPAKQNGSGKAVILVRSSDNQGTNWSNAVEVSISNGRQNWFPWITVDDATATVSVAYLSLDQTTGFTTNTYLAYSFDGGSTWGNIIVSDVGHTVAAIPGFAPGYCGDYIANSAWANHNYVAWNDDRTGQWQNYVSRVDFSQHQFISSSLDMNLNGPIDYTVPTATSVAYNSAGNINCPASSTFDIEPGTYITMVAAGNIVFSPGFKVHDGSTFYAGINSTVGGCTNGVNRDEDEEDISNEELLPAYTGDPTVQFALYPNPSNDDFHFRYLLPDRTDVILVIMDLQGKEIARLLDNASQPPGLNLFTYDASDLPGGLYIYKLIAGSYIKSGKLGKIR